MSNPTIIEGFLSIAKFIGQNEGTFQKWWYYIKKRWVLKNAICVVVEPFVFEKITDNRFINLERIYKNTLNEDQKGIINNLQKESNDVYLLFTYDGLKKLMTALRWLHQNEKFYLVLSSIELAKMLHIKDKNINIYKSSEPLFNTEVENYEEQQILKNIHQKLQSGDVFYNYDELNDKLKLL